MDSRGKNQFIAGKMRIWGGTHTPPHPIPPAKKPKGLLGAPKVQKKGVWGNPALENIDFGGNPKN